jgi:hypothetical protein
MKNRRIHRIGYEHIGANPDCDLVVTLTVKAQPVSFGLPENRDINLNRWRPGRECTMPVKIEASEEIVCWFVPDQDGDSVLRSI